MTILAAFAEACYYDLWIKPVATDVAVLVDGAGILGDALLEEFLLFLFAALLLVSRYLDCMSLSMFPQLDMSEFLLVCKLLFCCYYYREKGLPFFIFASTS